MNPRFKLTFVFILMLLVAAGTFYDLEINHFLEGYFPTFSRFFEVFGEQPIILIGVTSCAILSVSLQAQLKTKSNLGWLKLQRHFLNLSGVITASYGIGMILSYMAKMGTYGNSHGEINVAGILLSLIVGTISYALALILARKIPNQHAQYFKKIALLGLVFFVVNFVLVFTIKVVWARPRFWSIVEGRSEFMPWYSINGPATANEFMSFISGHSAKAFSMIYFSLYALNNRARQNQLYLFGLFWGCCVAASRIFIGQHFMTDVVFSGIFVIVFFEVLVRVFKIKKA